MGLGNVLGYSSSINFHLLVTEKAALTTLINLGGAKRMIYFPLFSKMVYRMTVHVQMTSRGQTVNEMIPTPV